MSLLSETLEDAWIHSSAIIDCVRLETTATIQCQTDQGLLKKVIEIRGQIDENKPSRIKNIEVNDVNYCIIPEKWHPDFDTIEEAELFVQDEFGNMCLSFLTRRFGAMKNITILMEAIITCQSGHKFKMKFNSGFFFASLTTGIVDSGHGLFERNRRRMMGEETSRTMTMTWQPNKLQKQENANIILDHFEGRRYRKNEGGAIRVEKYFLFPELEKYYEHKINLLDCPSGSAQVIDLVREHGFELICTSKSTKTISAFTCGTTGFQRIGFFVEMDPEIMIVSGPIEPQDACVVPSHNNNKTAEQYRPFNNEMQYFINSMIKKFPRTFEFVKMKKGKVTTNIHEYHICVGTRKIVAEMRVTEMCILEFSAVGRPFVIQVNNEEDIWHYTLQLFMFLQGRVKANYVEMSLDRTVLKRVCQLLAYEKVRNCNLLAMNFVEGNVSYHPAELLFLLQNLRGLRTYVHEPNLPPPVFTESEIRNVALMTVPVNITLADVLLANTSYFEIAHCLEFDTSILCRVAQYWINTTTVLPWKVVKCHDSFESYETLPGLPYDAGRRPTIYTYTNPNTKVYEQFDTQHGKDLMRKDGLIATIFKHHPNESVSIGIFVVWNVADIMVYRTSL
ncbi:hypothetical protein L3Y34_012747 [Caenorhabditis briggsae]|uniref:Uncharacterized protein n=2 Tax=Caenorhabditis briggsae TaxID=6238 RepID=A0AAE8ZWM7_CAEBR|nr:hypothetical protein L3Y34_012747 [Caenorhabditis briggsae]